VDASGPSPEAPAERSPPVPASAQIGEPISFQSVHLYVLGLSVLAAALIVGLIRWGGATLPHEHVVAFWLLVQFVVASELLPIAVPRREDVEEITTSTSFAFALMLAWGTTPAVYVLAGAAAVADLARRKPLRKLLFNVSQYAITIAAAGGVYALLGGERSISGGDVIPLVAAGTTFFVVNNLLFAVALGLAQRVSILSELRRDLLFGVAVTATLVAMSPVVVVVSRRSPLLVPLLLLPMAAVHLAARASRERADLIRQLEDSLARLTEANRMKDEFVAVVSHELRTPLTSIQGYLKTLLELELDEKDQRSFIEGADRQTGRLQRLIEQLLVVSRLESKSDRPSVGPVELHDLVRDVTDELEARRGGRRIDVRLPLDLPAVQTDAGKVHQVLSNLVENALKYSPSGSTVRIRGRAEIAGVVMSVEDEGFGVPEEARERIFERFFQVDQSLTRKAGGTGLGLYICRRLVHDLGGVVWLEATGPEGSTFSVRLPWSLDPDPATSSDDLEDRHSLDSTV
jgi:signal transduction histidine kinase